jgi:hypothetical protein
MKFSLDLQSRACFLLEDLIKADSEFRLEEYKEEKTEIGDIHKQIQDKDIFLFFYLDKTFFPKISLKSVFVVKKKEYLKLNRKQLGIKYYGRSKYYKIRIYRFLVNNIFLLKIINNRIMSKQYNG